MQLKKLSDSHYVVVSDEPINKGDFILINGCIIRQCDYVDGYMVIDTTQGKHHASVCKKITHSTNSIEEVPFYKVQPLDLSTCKSLVGEIDVEKKAREHYGSDYNQNVAYVKGYKECLEDNKHKRFTWEDMYKAILFGRNIPKPKSEDDEYWEYEKNFIESLAQPKDTWECEFIDGQLKLK